jgi:hypothetical protein
MWARVDSKGEIVAAHEVRAVGIAAEGVYTIAFDRGLERCSLQVTTRGSDPALSSVESGDREAGDVAVVRIFGADLEPRPGAFDVAALCSAGK